MRLDPDARGARQEIETVYIPEEDRGTLCISSQVGCTLTCSFCHTGTQKLVRNLTAAEIVGQIMLARDRLEEWPHQLAANPAPPAAGRYITNVVLMGMGEPLYNFDNVKAAMEIASDGEGHFALEAPHHIVDLGRRTGDRPRRRGDRHHAGDLAARHDG